MLFNEPKLLKCALCGWLPLAAMSFSALQRAEIAEIIRKRGDGAIVGLVSVLFNEPKLLKFGRADQLRDVDAGVSVLFNEPKLLKYPSDADPYVAMVSFSALQRAEIAEMKIEEIPEQELENVSVLFNEPKLLK